MIGALTPRQDARRALLEAAGWALRLRPSSTTGVQWRKILVVRPDHLGDLLMLTPALRRLRSGLPDAEIVGLVGPWGIPVLDRNPNLDRLIAWDFPWFDRRPRGSPFAPYASLARLSARLSGEQFDLAIHFRADFWWGALATRLANIPDRLGYDVAPTRLFLTRRVPLLHGAHGARENLRLAEVIAGPGSGEESLEFPVTDRDRSDASRILAPFNLDRPVVALQVGAGAPVKLWPLDRLGEVGRRLRDEFGVGVLVVGGPSETGAVRTVAHAVGHHAFPLAGKTTIGELAAVLDRCCLVIGPDSGPLHLAVATGAPTIHLYGPADARRFGPYGNPRWHVVIRSSRPCAPCNRLDFAPGELVAHRCVAEISVDDVVNAARTVLGESLRRADPVRPAP